MIGKNIFQYKIILNDLHFDKLRSNERFKKISGIINQEFN